MPSNNNKTIQNHTHTNTNIFAPIKLLLCSFQDKIDCDNVVKIGTCIVYVHNVTKLNSLEKYKTELDINPAICLKKITIMSRKTSTLCLNK